MEHKTETDAALIDMHGSAKLAGISYWVYRRTVRARPDHPAPFVIASRRQIFKRAEIEEFLGINQGSAK